MDSRLGGSYASQTDSGAFTDLNRLAQMKGKDKDSAENVKKVAKEFESLFLNQMMKSMRSANEALADKDSPFSSDTVKQYQDMYDQQMAVNLSREGGIGLASTLERQLTQKHSDVGRKNPFAQVENTLTTAPAAATGQALTANPRQPIAAVDPLRDDSGAINARRLALPGSIRERLAARISTEASSPEQVATIAEQIGDWKARPQATLTYAQTEEGSRYATAPRQIRFDGQADDAVASAATDHADAVATTAAKTRFSSKEEFIQTMLPMAESAAKRIGVDPRYLVAQAALETGWGKHMVKQADGSSANNLFGIKSHGWSGANATANTREYVKGVATTEKASFRAYDSYEQSFHDYVSFLQSNGRYEEALSTRGNSEQFMRELQQAGYATDPQYARKVNQIARNMNTYQSIQMLASAGAGTQRL